MATIKACVIGWPVAHSLSPKLHGFWLARYGIEGTYGAWPVQPDVLAEAMRRLHTEGYAGCNLTLPHKELVLPMLASMDKAAEAIGAANTIVVRQGGALHGMNTDAYGFMENIRPALSQTGKAVVLGAGGAARAAIWALAQAGFGEIVIVNRTQEKAQAMAKYFGAECRAEAWDARHTALAGADLLANATNLGLAGGEPLDIDLAALPPGALVTDMVYAPLETKLLADAKARGLRTVDGLGMLIHQAVPAFEAWFGVRPQVTGEERAWLVA